MAGMPDNLKYKMLKIDAMPSTTAKAAEQTARLIDWLEELDLETTDIPTKNKIRTQLGRLKEFSCDMSSLPGWEDGISSAGLSRLPVLAAPEKRSRGSC